VTEATSFIPWFERGEHTRILHTVGPVFRANLDVANHTLFHPYIGEEFLERYQRVIALYEAMMQRARAAMGCWSVIGRRVGLVKDVRVTIAKLLWEEAWQWSEDKKEGAGERAGKAEGA
jgi:hypothetical protein